MNLKRILGAAFVVVMIALNVSGSKSTQSPRNYDEFGDINCEDEMARLDNFAVNLQSAPADKGVIIFYGGRRFRGRLPKRGEAAARAARLELYLVQRRGIPSDHVTVIDGGYREEWTAELWIVSPGAAWPTPQHTIPMNEIKFRKGKSRSRDFRCQI